MPRWLRILTWFGMAVSVTAIYVWCFGVQTAIVLEERYSGRQYPGLWQAPVELTDTSISKSPGKRLSYFGCEFEVPWTDLNEQKTRLKGGWQTIVFHSGKGIVLTTFPAKERVSAFVGLGQKVDAETLRRLRILYGDETLRSDYAFTRAILEMSPANISIFTPRKEAVRSMMMLLLKQFIAREADPGIYLIRTKDFRGFQYGNPQSRPSEIVDELFSDDERLEFTFPCRHKGSSTGISQAEINRVIQSVRIVH